MDKYRRIYTDILNHITALVDSDPQADQIADRFKSWAEERCVCSSPLQLCSQLTMLASAFIQELVETEGN